MNNIVDGLWFEGGFFEQGLDMNARPEASLIRDAVASD